MVATPAFFIRLQEIILKNNFCLAPFYYLPDELKKVYEPEILVMQSSSSRMIISQDDRKYFRHGKFKIFFLVIAFINNQYWKETGNFKVERFDEVYLELALKLPEKEAKELKELLVDYASGSGDHRVFDECIKRIKER